MDRDPDTVPRVGFGYDIHRLVAGRALFLGCVEIPFPRGLAGHSDGDAAAHAVADALLGAAGLGDIGIHFPPGDPRWAGVRGAVLLGETRVLLAARGLRPLQVDVTIVAEAPRLAPYREAMQAATAVALGLDPTFISFKGRTNEGFDAIGQGEAIAAYAVALAVMTAAR
jgi:2-C-methyl-D-erythritol 2,4-cyclodiphosphate synthase